MASESDRVLLIAENDEENELVLIADPKQTENSSDGSFLH